MKLDLSPLIKAIERLEEGLERHQREPGDTQLRDGLIQRFEFTYEVSHKMFKRYLESVSPTPGEYDSADFQFLVSSASEQGLLLRDWSAWRRYRDLRARSSHTYQYQENVALEVVAGIPEFLEDTRHMRDQLQQHQT